MHFALQFLLTLLTVSSASIHALAESPSALGLCDKYTHKLYGNKTSDSQWAFIIQLVNTAEAGNYTTPNNGVAVTGILNDGSFNGQPISLFSQFNGSLVNSNVGPNAPIAMNWADDGGQAALRQGLTSYHVQSNQASLLTHLYQYFGSVLGCSAQGTGKFGNYAGHVSMFGVHKYMALNYDQISYHNEQFRLAALSMGFSNRDAKLFYRVLQKNFASKCLPASSFLAGVAPQLNSVCTDATCPSAKLSNCTAYPDNGTFPAPQPASVQKRSLMEFVSG